LFSNNNPLAQSYLDQAMSIWQRLRRRAEAFTLTYSSYVNSSNSAYALAFDQLTRALRISRSWMIVLPRLSSRRPWDHYLRIDELEQARDSLQCCVGSPREDGSVDLEAIVLDDFGYYLETLEIQIAIASTKEASLLDNTPHPLVRGDSERSVRASIAAGTLRRHCKQQERAPLASSLRTV